MRSIVLVSVLCFLISCVSGQFIETYVALVDPLSGVNEVCSVAYDSVANAVYVTGWRATLVFDAALGQKLARMNKYGDWVCSAAYDGKMYVLGSSVYSFDARSHRLLGTIPIGCETYQVTPPAAVCPTRHKLYFASDDSLVRVVDTRGDTLLRTIPVHGDFCGLCYAPELEKLYVADWGEVDVVDCVSDSVTTVIPGYTDRYWAQAYSPVSHKLYRGGSHELTVIDCLGDTIIKRFRLLRYLAFLAYDPVNNRVYCGYGDVAVVALDCATDSVVKVIELPPLDEWSVSYLNPSADKFYFASGDDYASISVIDCSGDTYVRTLPGGRPTFDPPFPNFCHDSRDNLVCFTNTEGGTVSVVDGAGDSLVRTVVTADDYQLDELWYNPVTDRIVGLDEFIGGISLIDAASNRLVGTRCVGVSPTEVAYNRVAQKVYLGDADCREVVAVSLLTDTMVSRIRCDGGLQPPLAVSPLGDKLYVRSSYSGDRVRVVDCRADTVSGSVALSEYPDLLAPSARLNKVYGLYDSTLFVVDAAIDSVVRTITLNHAVGALGYSPTQECWYCIGRHGCDTITVIDGRADTVKARVAAPALRQYEPRFVAFWNPLTDRLYYRTSEDSNAVFDCQTNRAVAYVPIQYPRLCDTVRNRVYGTDRDGVVVLDGATDSVIARFPLPEPGKMALNPARGRVYVGSGSSLVAVIRDTTTGIGSVGQLLTGRGPAPTVVRGVLYVPGLGHNPDSPSGIGLCPALCLLDATGRRVMELATGANDVRRIAPGVYFIVSGRSVVRKVVITR